jgi:hypothetical protein
MRVPETMEATKLLTWMRHGDPFMFAASGTFASGDSVAIIAFERPPELFVPPSKQGMELMHVERFRVDVRALGKGDPVTELALVPVDPPDFLIRQRGVDAAIGLECTQFADPQRRKATDLLRGLERNLGQMAADKFRHVRGMVLYVNYEHNAEVEATPSRSGRDTDHRAIAELIAAHRPDPSKIEQDVRMPFPEKPPDIGIDRTTSGVSVHAVPLARGHEPTGFMRRFGFEVALVYNTVHTGSSAWESVRETIAKKDTPGNDWLLITAGGVDRLGRIHPSEEVVAQLLIDHPEPLHCNHLARVTLHRWGNSDAWDLYPKVDCIAASPLPAPAPSDASRELTIHYPVVVLPPGVSAGRNDKCPCGSDRKYKQCHGGPPQVE